MNVVEGKIVIEIFTKNKIVYLSNNGGHDTEFEQEN